jgi:hypothetical protein
MQASAGTRGLGTDDRAAGMKKIRHSDWSHRYRLRSGEPVSVSAPDAGFRWGEGLERGSMGVLRNTPWHIPR